MGVSYITGIPHPRATDQSEGCLEPACLAGGKKQVSKWSFICLSPSSTSHPLSPWKNFLPQNQSLVPERLGTAAIYCGMFSSIPGLYLLDAIASQICLQTLSNVPQDQNCSLELRTTALHKQQLDEHYNYPCNIYYCVWIINIFIWRLSMGFFLLYGMVERKELCF